MSRGRTVNSVFPSDKCPICPPTNLRQFRHGLLGSKEAAYLMHPNAILHEIRQLYNVSDRLDLLAERHPLVSDALTGIAGSIRNTATLLEVVVAMKMPTFSGIDPATA
jgi:hypothetical protein